MSSTLVEELQKIEEAIELQIKEFVERVQAQKIQTIVPLLRGYLMDKDYPQDADIQIDGDQIIFVAREESQPE